MLFAIVVAVVVVVVVLISVFLEVVAGITASAISIRRGERLFLIEGFPATVDSSSGILLSMGGGGRVATMVVLLLRLAACSSGHERELFFRGWRKGGAGMYAQSLTDTKLSARYAFVQAQWMDDDALYDANEDGDNGGGEEEVMGIASKQHY